MNEWVDDASNAMTSAIRSGKQTTKEGSDRIGRVLDSVRDSVENSRKRLEHYIQSVTN